MDRRATATPMAAAARTPPDKARPTIALTAPARHTMKAGARPTRTPMAAKRRANMAKARRIRMPMAAKLRVNTEKGRLTRTLMAAPLQLNMGRVRRIRMFTAAPLLPRMVKARTTPAPMVTALRIIRQPLIMAIIRLPRSTTTDQHALTATGGRPPPLSQPPLLLVRLSLQQMQTLPMLMLRPRQLTLTTLDTTPAQPRVNLRRPQQPWLRHQATIPWGRLVGALPAGCITPTVHGTTYYLCGNTWFSAAYGANGVYYRVVPGPGG